MAWSTRMDGETPSWRDELNAWLGPFVADLGIAGGD